MLLASYRPKLLKRVLFWIASLLLQKWVWHWLQAATASSLVWNVIIHVVIITRIIINHPVELLQKLCTVKQLAMYSVVVHYSSMETKLERSGGTYAHAYMFPFQG
jgi:hypothetical protein